MATTITFSQEHGYAVLVTCAFLVHYVLETILASRARNLYEKVKDTKEGKVRFLDQMFTSFCVSASGRTPEKGKVAA